MGWIKRRMIASESGVVLIPVLLTGALLVVLGMGFMNTGMTEVVRSNRDIRTTQARNIAEAGVAHAMSVLYDDVDWRGGLEDVAFADGQYDVSLEDQGFNRVLITSRGARADRETTVTQLIQVNWRRQPALGPPWAMYTGEDYGLSGAQKFEGVGANVFVGGQFSSDGSGVKVRGILTLVSESGSFTDDEIRDMFQGAFDFEDVIIEVQEGQEVQSIKIRTSATHVVNDFWAAYDEGFIKVIEYPYDFGGIMDDYVGIIEETSGPYRIIDTREMDPEDLPVYVESPPFSPPGEVIYVYGNLKIGEGPYHSNVLDETYGPNYFNVIIPDTQWTGSGTVIVDGDVYISDELTRADSDDRIMIMCSGDIWLKAPGNITVEAYLIAAGNLMGYHSAEKGFIDGDDPDGGSYNLNGGVMVGQRADINNWFIQYENPFDDDANVWGLVFGADRLELIGWDVSP